MQELKVSKQRDGRVDSVVVQLISTCCSVCRTDFSNEDTKRAKKYRPLCTKHRDVTHALYRSSSDLADVALLLVIDTIQYSIVV